MAKSKQTTMNVSVTPKLAKYVASKIEDGDYASASELVRESLRRMQLDEQAVIDLERKHRAGMRSVKNRGAIDGETAMRSHRGRLVQQLARRKAS